MKIAIVKKSDLSIMGHYQGDGPDMLRYGGPMGDRFICEHIPFTEAWDGDCVKAVMDGDSIVIEQDEDKAAAKLAVDWQNFRNARDAKLLACDWTQLVDSPLNSQDKSAWAAYRQALRDLPANTEDPKSPIWPSEPGQG